jgi:hypothetical protein
VRAEAPTDESRFSRRTLLVLLVAALAATGAHPTKFSRALTCGTERWTVKTLQDRPHLISAKFKSVAQLAALTRPQPAPMERSNFERHIYSVDAAVTHVLMEADQDLHVVLEDGPAHMVAESPNAPTWDVGPLSTRHAPLVEQRR